MGVGPARCIAMTLCVCVRMIYDSWCEIRIYYGELSLSSLSVQHVTVTVTRYNVSQEMSHHNYNYSQHHGLSLAIQPSFIQLQGLLRNYMKCNLYLH